MRKPIVYCGLKDRDRKVGGRIYEGRFEDDANAEVIPGESIRLFGSDYGKPYDILFKIGDVAVYGSYNLIYTGKIIAISPKTVTIDKGRHYKSAKRLKIYDFSWRNKNFDAARIAEENFETLRCI